MKNKLIILFTLVLVFSVFPQAGSAYLIARGYKNIHWCYEISNINDYPDYIFVFTTDDAFPFDKDYEVINQGDCFSFYQVYSASIYAIKKIEFNESELNRESFEESNPKVIKSNIQLSGYSEVHVNDPLQKKVVSLDIQSLSKNNFNIQKSKVTYTYTDGTTEEKIFQSQEVTPKPSKTAILPLWFAKFWYIILPEWFAKFWYIILPIVAIVLINIILLIRRLKK